MPPDDIFGREGPGLEFRPAEFAALRRTIAMRGTARLIIAPLSCIAWAALGLSVVAWDAPSAAALLTLAPLVAGFEAVHALHVGVERIGRYIQVWYEGGSEGPRWETAAMAVGPALPGGGIDPLFSAVFVAAAAVNLLLALHTPPDWPWAALLTSVHGAFAFRVVRARLAATRQRPVELESFRAILLRAGERDRQ
jgi:hypothetical protein